MTTQFHSDYEILNWLASQDSFEGAVDELRDALASGKITGGRAVVEKWLSVYDDVMAGRVVRATNAESAAPPAQHGEIAPSIDTPAKDDGQIPASAIVAPAEGNDRRTQTSDALLSGHDRRAQPRDASGPSGKADNRRKPPGFRSDKVDATPTAGLAHAAALSAPEPHLWGDTRHETTPWPTRRIDPAEALALAAGRWARAGVALALIALAGVATVAWALWPQIEPRLRELLG